MTEEAGPGAAVAPSGGFRKGAFGVTGSGDTSGFGGLVRVEPGGAVALHSTERPYGGYFDEVTDALVEAVGRATYDAAVPRVLVDRGEITYFVVREHLLTLVQALRRAYEEAAAQGRTGQFAIDQRDGNVIAPAQLEVRR